MSAPKNDEIEKEENEDVTMSEVSSNANIQKSDDAALSTSESKKDKKDKKKKKKKDKKKKDKQKKEEKIK